MRLTSSGPVVDVGGVGRGRGRGGVADERGDGGRVGSGVRRSNWERRLRLEIPISSPAIVDGGETGS